MERLVAWKTSWIEKKKKGDREEREREEKQERYSKDDIIGYGMVATGSVCVCVFL